MSFNNRIKEARKNKGFTQEQLGESIGVAKSTIAGYEKGTSHPDEEKMIKLMNILKVDANYLWQDDMKKESFNSKHLPDLYSIKDSDEVIFLNDLPPEDQKTIRDFFEFLINKNKNK